MPTIASMIYNIEAQTSSIEKSMATVTSLFQQTEDAAARLTAGMTLAGQTSADSMQMVAGMSESGRAGMEALTEATHTSALSVSHLADAFNDPIGAVKNLSTSLVTDLAEGGTGAAVLGVAALTGGLAALVGGAIEAATHFVGLGEEVLDASYKMSDTVERTAALKSTMDVAGGSIEQAANLMFKMNAALETGGAAGTKVETGLREIGLSVEALAALSPAEQFLKIADAFRQNTDETNRSGVAMELFSRQGRDAIALLMKPLAELNAEWAKNPGMTTAAATQAEELGMKWRSLKESMSWAASDVGLAVIRLLTAAGDPALAVSFSRVGTSAVQAAKDVNLFSATVPAKFKAALDEVNSAGDGWRGTLDTIDGSILDNMRDLTAAGVPLKTLEEYYGLTATQGKAFADMLKAEASPALKAFQGAVTDVASAGTSWQGTLDTIDGSILDNMRDLTAAGVSIKTLETYYGLTAAQGKAFTDMLKDEGVQLKLQEASVLAVTKLWDDYAATVASDSGTAYDKAGAAIDKWYTDTVAAHQKAKTDTAEFYSAVSALDDAKWNHLNQNTLQSDKYSQEHYQKIADAAQQAFQFALDHASSYTQQETQLLRDAARAAEQASNHWAQSAMADMDRAAGHATTVIGAITGVATGAIAGVHAAAAPPGSAPWSSATPGKNTTPTANMSLNPIDASKESFTTAVPTIMISPENKAHYIAALQQIEADYLAFPGRAPGQNGITGLMSNDASGWSQMLNEQTQFLALKNALPGYEMGGPVPSTSPALLHAGEYVVPKGGALVSGGGGDVTINLHLYTPLGTPQQIVGVIKPAIVDVLKSQGVRFA
jgi:hypothetical protein